MFFPHVVFFHRKCWLAKVQAHLQPLHVSNAPSTPPLRGAGLVGEGTAGCRDGLHSPLAEICYFPCYFRNNNYSFTSVHHCWRATSVFDLLHCWCYCLPPPSLIEYRQWTVCALHTAWWLPSTALWLRNRCGVFTTASMIGSG